MKKMLVPMPFAMTIVLILNVITLAQPGQRSPLQGGTGASSSAAPGRIAPGPPSLGAMWDLAYYNRTALLRHEFFRKQLGITEEQAQQIGRTGRDRATGRAPKRTDMSREVLTPQQLKKADILVFQVSGGLSTPMVEVFEALDLTPEQKLKLVVIEDEFRVARQGKYAQIQRVRSLSPEERMELLQELPIEIEEKVQALLTNEQKARAAKLTKDGKEIREKYRQLTKEAFARQPSQRDGSQRGR